MDYFNDEENTDFLIFENNKVYIDYNDNLFTFHKVDEKEKILEIDLDNQEIRDKSNDSNDGNLSNEIMFKTDLITLDYFPLCMSHCNLTLCYEQDLPQVLSSELLVQFLQIFPIAKNPSLVCGYDSLGAGCVINHLHFEFLMLDDFPNTEISSLPIEKLSCKLLLETKLKHKNEEEISLFDGTTLLKLSKISSPFFCWKIECFFGQENNNDDISSMNNMYQNSISHMANLILSKLIDVEVPHNIIITNQGTVFYIIPRKFEKKEHPINSCWNDLAGLVTCKSSEYYNEITEEKINEFFKTKISMEENDFNHLNKLLLDLVESVYEVQKVTGPL